MVPFSAAAAGAGHDADCGGQSRSSTVFWASLTWPDVVHSDAEYAEEVYVGYVAAVDDGDEQLVGPVAVVSAAVAAVGAVAPTVVFAAALGGPNAS